MIPKNEYFLQYGFGIGKMILKISLIGLDQSELALKLLGVFGWSTTLTSMMIYRRLLAA
jgi:hypothetical protein